jgi:hypothetical protein
MKEGLVFSTLVLGAQSETIMQYLGMVPVTGEVSWLKATFPSNYTATSASQVTIESVDDTVAQLGEWQNFDFGGEPMLTMKNSGDRLYSQLNTGIAPEGPTDDYPGGCCVDIFKSVSTDGDEIDWDIESLIFSLYENTTDTDSNTGTPFAYANHVFDMTTYDDTVYAIVDVTYHEPGLDFAEVDSVIFFNPLTGDVMPTKDGDMFFSYYQHVGTTSTDTADSIYNIMYTSGGPEQYHMNGVTRFQAYDGTWILGATFRSNAEAVLMKCPYTYSSADGGGTILQRFGTPTGHRFGYSTSDGEITAMHNLFYTIYPTTNKETLTIFVNDQNGYSNSRVFEFDLKLTPEPSTSYDDTVFDTDYISATVGYFTDMWGGARPVGQGVWLVGFDEITALDLTSQEVRPTDPEEIEKIEAKKQEIRLANERKRIKKPTGTPGPPPDDQGDDHQGDDHHGPSDDDIGPYTIYDPFTFVVAV